MGTKITNQHGILIYKRASPSSFLLHKRRKNVFKVVLMPNAYSTLVLTVFFLCLEYGTNVGKLNTPTKVRKLKIYDPLPNLCKKEIQKNMFHNTVKVLCHYTDASETVFLGHYSHDILSFNQIILNNSYFTKN